MNKSLQDNTIRGLQEQRQTVTERYNALREQYLFWHMYRQTIQEQHITQTSQEHYQAWQKCSEAIQQNLQAIQEHLQLRQQWLMSYLPL